MAELKVKEAEGWGMREKREEPKGGGGGGGRGGTRVQEVDKDDEWVVGRKMRGTSRKACRGKRKKGVEEVKEIKRRKNWTLNCLDQ